MRSWWLLVILGLVAGGCGVSRVSALPSETTGGGGRPVAGGRAAAPSFLATTDDNGTTVLQLRRLSDGRTLETVLRSARGLSAVQTSATSALVALSGDCTATLEQINLLSGDIRVLRRLSQAVYGIALSPDGTELAYSTYAHCTVAPPCRGACGGSEAFDTGTLAVLNMHAGAVSETTPAGPDPHPGVGGPIWSPNGKQIAVTLADGTPGQVAVVNAAHPDFHTARLLRLPAGCDDAPIAWTALGILTDEYCGDGTSTLVTHFLAVTNTGQRIHRWAVPSCTYGISAEPATNTNKVIVETDVGYGTCSPQTTWTARFWTIAGLELKPLFAVPGAGFNVGLL
jgi:hypothetical protein